MLNRALSLIVASALLALSLPATGPASAVTRTPAKRPLAASPGLGDRAITSKLTKPPRSRTTEARVIIKLRRGVSLNRAKTQGRTVGYRVVDAVPELGWAVIEATSPHVTKTELQRKSRAAGVAEKATSEILIRPAYAPTDPLFGDQWGFQNTGQSGGTAGADARTVTAWDWSRGSGTVVAITDTGVDLGHPDLAGQAWVNPDEVAGNGIDDDGNGKVDDVNGWDFYRNENTVFDGIDGDKHGTHVAGTIAASTSNSIGGAGMAPASRIMPLKFLGPGGGTDTAAAAAIVYAVDEGAHVINASWGSSSSSPVVSDAISYAARHGVLVVCAAGNAGTNNDTTPFYPASYPATNVVSVAALTRTDGLASYSNRGAGSVDLGAPGSAIVSTQPQLGSTLVVDHSPYKVVYHGFPVEYVTDSNLRTDLVARSMSALTTSKTTPVLVVDDSWPLAGSEGATTRLDRYTSALANSGYTNVTTWRRDTLGIPPVSAMNGKVVVWFTGAASFGLSTYQSYGTLSSTERTNLGSFLSGGGRLLLSSGDLGYDMTWIGGSALSWYTTYLHAAFADDDPWSAEVTGRGSGAFAGMVARVDDPLRHTDGCDDLMPADGSAAVAADWSGYAAISGTSMAAPHVTGAVALARSRMASPDAAELKSRLLLATRPVAALSGNSITGGALDTAALVGTLPAPDRFVATASIEANTLTWSNPTDADFARMRILARTDAVPSGPEDPVAELVYEGTDTQALHKPLTAGIPVYYAAFSANTLGAWSPATTASSTALAQPAADDAYSVRSGGTLTVAAPGVRTNDQNTSGVLAITAPPANGRATLQQDGSFTYTPNAGYFGADSFTYSVTQGDVTGTAVVSMDVRRYRLDSLSMNAASPGTKVTFTGTGFGEKQGTSYVSFAGTRAAVVTWSDTTVIAEVPVGAPTGYAGIVVEGRATNGLWFRTTPRLDSLSVTLGEPGTLVKMTGAGFGISQGSGFVSFAGTRALVVSWAENEVVAIVPEGATSGYAGVYQNGATSNGKWFVPFNRPVVESTSHYHGAPGTAITFNGRDFGATQKTGYVAFAGVAATVVSWSDTQVVALVPEGATAGYAGVSQNGLMSNGKWFIPSDGPRVVSLNAALAPMGETITISGTGFGTIQDNGWVTFGGVPGEVVSWSDTSIVTFVPLGASAGYVGVVQGGIVSNGIYFIPTL